MAKRPPYCLIEDVLRIYDAQESIDRLDSADKDLIRDAIDDVGSHFEVETGHAFRETRVGAPNTPSTYEYQGIEGNHRQPPLRVTLDHRYILPIDSAQGDTVEYRSGRDEWTDITDKAGDDYTLRNEEGLLRIYRWLVQHIVWNVPDDRYLRLSYRHGALGGRQDQGGQTTLDGSLGGADTDTSVSVANAGRLPNSGTLLIYGDDAEYVELESVDYTNDTLTVSRGERATSAVSHADGDTVHYCPNGVRMMMAGKVAEELQEYEMFTDHLVDTGDGISASERVETWSSRYDDALASHSNLRML